MKKIILLLLTVCFVSAGFAGTIKGKVIDARTGQPMTGAKIEIGTGKNKYAATVDAAGCYKLTNVPAGAYTIAIQSPGYKKHETDIILTNNDDIKGLNFNLEPDNMELQEIRIVATRM